MASLAPSPSLRELVPALKKCVVNIERNVSFGLCHDKVGVFLGTGFILDAKLGIVATNAHVAGVSPCQMKVTFENGESCEARLLHTDAWHDFAFLRLNLEEVDWSLSEVEMGDSFDLKEQDECCLIGNNDSEEYSVKFGVVTNLVINRGECHSHCFQTSFDRTGGSSGSPVFSARGLVVGIHKAGSDTTSIELRIEYLKVALNQLRTQTLRRGTIGIELDLQRISTVVKHCSFPKELVDQLRDQVATEIKHVLTVERLVPHGRSEPFLRPGDVIFKVNETIIEHNLFLFDKLVDELTGSHVDLTILRNGETKTFSITVDDVEATKVRKFAMFAGGVFHELTPALRSRFSIDGTGIFLSQVAKGSCLSELGEGSSKHPTSFIVLLEELHGMKTHTLEAFIEGVRRIGTEGKKHIYALSRNLRSFSSALLTAYISLDLRFEPLRIFSWDSETLEWIEEGNTRQPLFTSSKTSHGNESAENSSSDALDSDSETD